ncbi:dioxygenase [Tumebacillus sp. ITR2]|uniref:Dioxygenase n=1 Tax=Tumebacillus amylolyticus TaxID=2801339 RepID=A0ABS1J5Z3_9BACL|nr:class III extradiol ring-cleavage dioxygenase [Tumebacillus amylolyticus]MBL0385696.1 dioxygenase [Tumebacillus amylolyticus]
MMPTFFLGHGSPMIAIEESPYVEFLQRLVSSLERRPKAVVLFSAHWEAVTQQISRLERYSTIYDFGGFPDALYQIKYEAPGDIALADEIADLLQQAGISSIHNPTRGLDHGAWVPLRHLFPEADIPVVAMSVNSRLTGDGHYLIGKALAALRAQDVLIIGSGGTVHNFSTMKFGGGPTDEWAVTFDEWVTRQIQDWNYESLANARTEHPYGAYAAPTPEHYIPLLYAMGAADETRKGTRIYDGYQLGNLSLNCWKFD